MMYEAKQTTEMIPIVHKLIEMDPSNPDDVMLFTYAFTGLQGSTKDPAVKKWAIDSVMYWGKYAEAMTYKVSFTDFERQTNRTLLVGTVENRGKEARAFTIEFEFLGKDGTVVQKQTVNVASVAPGAIGFVQSRSADRRCVWSEVRAVEVRAARRLGLEAARARRIAQLDRASDYGSEGWGFESLCVYGVR